MPTDRSANPRIGAHVDSTDPLTAAAATGADLVQFFLADPQGWKAPVRHEHFDAIRADRPRRLHPCAVRAQPRDAEQPHPDPEPQAARPACRCRCRDRCARADRPRRPRQRRRRSGGRRRQLAQDVRARRRRGRIPVAHPDREHRRAETTRWPAGSIGSAALWEAIGEFGVGFCLDTCHAHAGGEDLVGDRRPRPGHHRPGRSGARQRQPGRVRLRRGPARQHRQR